MADIYFDRYASLKCHLIWENYTNRNRNTLYACKNEWTCLHYRDEVRIWKFSLPRNLDKNVGWAWLSFRCVQDHRWYKYRKQPQNLPFHNKVESFVVCCFKNVWMLRTACVQQVSQSYGHRVVGARCGESICGAMSMPVGVAARPRWRRK